MNYHAHVYFEDLVIAQKRREHLKIQWGEVFHFFSLHSMPIGPHPCPSFGFAFEERYLPQVRQWMSNNLDVFTGMVHPIIADDLAAHTLHAEWFGGVIELNKNYLQ